MRRSMSTERRPGPARLVALSLALALAGTAAQAAGWPPNGPAIATHGLPAQGIAACSSCHGPAFQGGPAGLAPALAGRDAAAMMDRLDTIASTPGGNQAMRHTAQALSMAERAAVSLYLARLPPATQRPAASPAQPR